MTVQDHEDNKLYRIVGFVLFALTGEGEGKTPH